MISANTNRLPSDYLSQMQQLLGDDYQAYLKSFEQSPLSAIRINTLKITVADFLAIAPFKLMPIPWASDGFYIAEDSAPAKHPYYHAGLYYIQEPSAMAPAASMPLKNGDCALDLCAAPGGKTTQIACAVGGDGAVLANDISASRQKALIANIERMGIKNVIVSAEAVAKLNRPFADYFNHVLIDAPCSGEGMFRKDTQVIKAWSPDACNTYSQLQSELLNSAINMLASGGSATYSTCTFTPKENEMVVSAVLAQHHNLQNSAIDNGVFSAPLAGYPQLGARLLPYRQQGEGHYLARLIKTAGQAAKRQLNANNQPPSVLAQFMDDVLVKPLHAHFKIIGDKVYALPKIALPCEGLRILRSGWLLGQIKGSQFIPAHSFATGLKREQLKRCIDLTADDIRVMKYLKCETLTIDEQPLEKGWYTVCVDGFTLGWGKVQGNQLKNKYPPHLRLTYESR